MFKPIDRTKKIITFKDACCIYPSDSSGVDTTTLTTSFNTNTLTTLALNDDYVKALKDLLTTKMDNDTSLHIDPYTTVNDVYYINAYIFKNFGNRKLYSDYFKYFSSYENTTEEISWILALMFDDIHACVNANIYKWSNLLKSTLLDFNPLWNVDGVTGEIRQVDHTGTSTDTHSGTDTLTKSGTDTNVKDGSIDLDYLGTKINDKAGKEKTTNSGTDTNTTAKTTTESTTWYNTEKNEMQNGKISTLEYLGATDNTLYSDMEHFNDRKDTTTYNSVQDERTYDLTDETTFNSALTKLLNLHDKDLFMQIKQGNIGVTTTTKLLTEFRDYVNYNIVNVISRDIVNAICEGVY